MLVVSSYASYYCERIGARMRLAYNRIIIAGTYRNTTRRAASIRGRVRVCIRVRTRCRARTNHVMTDGILILVRLPCSVLY